MPKRTDKHVRKTVGRQTNPPDDLLQRVWILRDRMLRLGIEFENDDERIRKVVGESRERS